MPQRCVAQPVWAMGCSPQSGSAAPTQQKCTLCDAKRKTVGTAECDKFSDPDGQRSPLRRIRPSAANQLLRDFAGSAWFRPITAGDRSLHLRRSGAPIHALRGFERSRTGVKTPLAFVGAPITITIINLIVILIVLMLLFGGGGFYLGGPMVGGGAFGLLLVIGLILLLTGRLGSR